MNYIKAKFLKDDKPAGRAYTYCTEDDVKTGDFVMDLRGSKLVVVCEPVDMTWVEAYGPDKVAVVKKFERPTEYRIIDIWDSKTETTRKDGRYPLRLGRIVKEPKPNIGMPMILEYLRNADGSDYSDRSLRTSRVIEIREKAGILEVETMNSIYIFEPAAAGESEE